MRRTFMPILSYEVLRPSRHRRGAAAIAIACTLASAAVPAFAALREVDCNDTPSWALAALEHVNTVRRDGRGCRGDESAVTSGAARPLRWNERLTDAARQQAGAMAARQRLGHLDRAGQPLGSRLASSGYAMRQAVENVAFGFATIDALVGGWRSSEGHCANLMNLVVVDLGLACEVRDGVHYWSLVMGRPADAD